MLGYGMTVKAYPYRTARVYGMVSVKFHHEHELHLLHQVLAKFANVDPDNHQCFTIERAGQFLAIQFSDWTATFGVSIRQEPW